MPCSRSSFDSVASESGLPVTDGKISPSPCESRRASSSTASARGGSGTLCSRLVLDRSAGIVQTLSHNCLKLVRPHSWRPLAQPRRRMPSTSVEFAVRRAAAAVRRVVLGGHAGARGRGAARQRALTAISCPSPTPRPTNLPPIRAANTQLRWTVLRSWSESISRHLG